MTFDVKKFSKEKFSFRIAAVPVPDLKAFFPEGDEPVWKVRGLTGHEVGRAAESSDRSKSMAAIITSLVGDSAKEKADSLMEAMGLSKDVPADIAKRIEHLALGSVDPVCTIDLAVLLCERFAIEFYQLTNKIMELTGMGQVPGKQPPSGEMQKSAPASPSAIPEGVSCTK